MSRHHVHCAITDETYLLLDPMITVSLDAENDHQAQELVMLLLPDLEFDVVEIDSDEPEEEENHG